MSKKAHSDGLVTSAILLSIFFVVLSFLSALNPYFAFDPKISILVQSSKDPLVSAWLQFVSFIGSGPILTLLVVLISTIYYFFGLHLESLLSFVSTNLALLASFFIKEIVNRPRPSTDLVRVHQYLSDKSFPSGHTIAFTVLFGFMYFVSRNKVPKFISAILIIFVGLSRIYLGEHWTSDVLGGYVFGSAWLLGTIDIYQRKKKTNASR